jgi:hypothetical protein
VPALGAEEDVTLPRAEGAAPAPTPVPCHHRHLLRLRGWDPADRRAVPDLPGVPAQAPEADGGDPLQLTHLFGISDPTAIRNCAELGPPDGTAPDD